MRTSEKRTHYSQQYASISFFFFVVFLLFSTAAAQPGPPPQSNTPNPNTLPRFSPPLAVIIAVLVAALFFMAFFSIYIRHCSYPPAAGRVGRGLSMRPRRAAAARGLDRSVIDTLPTFSYSEVKQHKIGKGALECAVCLNEFEDDETLRLLPKCDHVFHPECIDAWLESHVTCPVCRANLALQTEPDKADEAGRIESRNEEIVVQVDDDEEDDDQPQHEMNPGFELTNRTTRSWSMKPKLLGLGKLRSHSTGHSLVQPGENLERFTLRLPEVVRKEVIDRAMSNRSRSLAMGLQREGSSRKGYRNGSIRAARSYRRIELPGREANSDRWVFFTRGMSFISPRTVAERGEGSGSKKGGGGKSPGKMPSFKCLDPKADGEDENRLVSGQPSV